MSSLFIKCALSSRAVSDGLDAILEYRIICVREQYQSVEQGVKDLSVGILYTVTNNLGDEIQQIALLKLLRDIGVTPRFELNRDTLRSPFYTLPRNSRLIIHGWLCHERHMVESLSSALYNSYLQADARDSQYFFDTDYIDRRGCRVLYISVHFTPNFLAEISSRSELRAHFLRHGPVGCRDQHTLNGLRNLGIAAYFSGCLTMQFRKTHFDPTSEDHDEEIWVDMPKDYHSDRAVRLTNELPNSFDETQKNVRQRRAIAEAQLVRLGAAKKVRTSRLHVYLPCVALGGTVDFVHEHVADRYRFSGLVDLDSNQREALCLHQRQTIERFISRRSPFFFSSQARFSESIQEGFLARAMRRFLQRDAFSRGARS